MTEVPTLAALPAPGSLGRRCVQHGAETSWAAWAVPQLMRAADVAARAAVAPDRPALAVELYREWFNPVVAPAGGDLRRSLAGVYRAAHVGSRSRHAIDEMWVLDRHDVVGRDGWWRTWNDSWVPTRSRAGATRVLFTPIPNSDALAEFVGAATTHLRGEQAPWLLACATDPRRVRRSAAAVLYLPDGVVPAGLVEAVQPMLADDTPPLCLRLGAGAALAEYPSNGMSFGEHRCHLIARALRTSAARRAPLRAIAATFSAHGVDPSAPHLASRQERRAA